MQATVIVIELLIHSFTHSFIHSEDFIAPFQEPT